MAAPIKKILAEVKSNLILDLFEAKKTGLFDMLDEEARLPRASAQHFTLAVQQTHSKHPRLGVYAFFLLCYIRITQQWWN